MIKCLKSYFLLRTIIMLNSVNSYFISIYFREKDFNKKKKNGEGVWGEEVNIAEFERKEKLVNVQIPSWNFQCMCHFSEVCFLLKMHQIFWKLLSEANTRCMYINMKNIPVFLKMFFIIYLTINWFSFKFLLVYKYISCREVMVNELNKKVTIV